MTQTILKKRIDTLKKSLDALEEALFKETPPTEGQLFCAAYDAQRLSQYIEFLREKNR